MCALLSNCESVDDVVCCHAPHSHVAHFCSHQSYMQALNWSTPVPMRFSVGQAFCGKSNPAHGGGGYVMNLCSEVGLVCQSCLRVVATQLVPVSFGPT